jgi:hypothetical protein
MQINPNDWVTISKDYDSWLEWGWSPEKLDDLPPISPMGFGASPPKTPQQAARFETPGSPEYEAAVAKGLGYVSGWPDGAGEGDGVRYGDGAVSWDGERH